MINQVNHTFAMNDTMEPFRHLLKPGTPIIWSPSLQEKFEKAKKMIVQAFTDRVNTYKDGRQTCLAKDCSNRGLGYFLLKKN